MICEDLDAVFADESNYEIKLNSSIGIDGAILINVSGAKHGPIIAENLKRRGLKVVLLTCTENSPASKYCDISFVFPKIPEPYTYNTSTYMGMVLGKTREDLRKILKYLEEVIEPRLICDFSNINSFYFLIPKKFDNIKKMFEIKFQELFGRRIARDFFTPDFAEKHATDIVETEGELFISLGYENNSFGKKRLNIPILENADYGTIMAIGYYIIGKIQSQKYPYYKESIVEWCKKRGIEPLVK